MAYGGLKTELQIYENSLKENKFYSFTVIKIVLTHADEVKILRQG